MNPREQVEIIEALSSLRSDVMNVAQRVRGESKRGRKAQATYRIQFNYRFPDSRTRRFQVIEDIDSDFASDVGYAASWAETMVDGRSWMKKADEQPFIELLERIAERAQQLLAEHS